MPQDWIMGLIGGGLVDRSATGTVAKERLAFLAGLFLIPAVAALAMGGASTYVTSNWAVLIIAGLFVGLGTRIANGCTSGHGVCGISRLSLRGIVATVFYIGAGGLTVVVFKHLLGVI